MALAHDQSRVIICACIHLVLSSGRYLLYQTMALKFSEKKCPMCTFEARSVKIVLSHLRSVHSNDPRFNVMCGLEGCFHTFRTFSALYSHIYRRHRSIGIVTSDKYAFQRAVALPEQYSSQLEDDMEVTDHLASYDDHYIPSELLLMACGMAFYYCSIRSNSSYFMTWDNSVSSPSLKAALYLVALHINNMMKHWPVPGILSLCCIVVNA